MRLPNEIREEIITRLKKGDSINKISRELGLWKGTVHKYYQKIIGRKYKKIVLTPGYSKTEGELVGIFAGDGSLCYVKNEGSYYVNVHFGTKNTSYASYVKTMYDNYFGKNFGVKKQHAQTFRIYTKSKVIYNFFFHYLDFNPHVKHCTAKLKTLSISDEFLRGFLKGFLDTDGTICRTIYGLSIAYYTTSQELAIQLQQIMAHFGIKSGITSHQKDPKYKVCYKVYVLKENVGKFINMIEPFKWNKGQ